MNARRTRRLSARDLRALAWIGEGYEVAQYQLEAAVFGELSPTVVSRFVRRAAARRLVVVERLYDILVLTEGRRRLEQLTSATATFDRLMVERLPEETGAKALAVLRERLVGM